jgi:hypothetical protein
MFLFLLAQAAPVPKPVEIDFDKVEVNATAPGPSLQPVQGGRPPARFLSPIKGRTDFDDEIARSASEVR